MAIDIKTIQQFDNGYSHLEVSAKNVGSVYYSLPTKNAKSFSEDLKKHVKNSNLNSSIALGASAIVGVLGASAFTKKMSKVTDIIAKIASGAALAGISGYFVNDYNNKKYDKLIAKYQVNELKTLQ